MISVQVIRRTTGKAIKGAKVAVSFKGLLRGMSKKKNTDSKGIAHFDNSPGHGTIFVDGKNEFEGKISGLTVIYK